MLGEFTRENETNTCLDLTRRNGRLFRVGSKLCERMSHPHVVLKGKVTHWKLR